MTRSVSFVYGEQVSLIGCVGAVVAWKIARKKAWSCSNHCPLDETVR